MRLFRNDNNTNSPNGTIEENGCSKMNYFTSRALEEISKMGYTHVWYTGLIEHATTTDYTQFDISKDNSEVVKGKAGSPYAIKDYYDIDPDLAEDVPNRMQEFHSLVERTHKAGLNIIIDFVPNHLARNYVSDSKPLGIADFGSNDITNIEFDKDNNFYYLVNQTYTNPVKMDDVAVNYSEYPAKVTGNDCISPSPQINDWYETVKLNYGINIFNNRDKYFSPIPDTWNKMRDVLLYWAEKGVDGFRCDMAEMVPVEFWHWVIKEVKKEFPKIIFIAEIYSMGEYRNFIKYGGFDFLYDKVGMYDTLKDIIQGRKPTSEISKVWSDLDGIQSKMLFFLENHDEQRIASDYFACNPFKAIPAMIVSGAMFTNPLMIYFGQELGEKAIDAEGFSGNDGRTTIFDYWCVNSYQNWVNKGAFDGKQLNETQLKLRNWYVKFLNFLKSNDLIHKGFFYDLMWANYENDEFDSTKIFAFLRHYEGRLMLVAVNFSDEINYCNVLIPEHAFETAHLIHNDNIILNEVLFEENEVIINPENAISKGIPLCLDPWEGAVLVQK